MSTRRPILRELVFHDYLGRRQSGRLLLSMSPPFPEFSQLLQISCREDFERDVMLQPKRHSWDSYVPSKSKSKTTVVSGGPEDPLLQGWPWSQAIRWSSSICSHNVSNCLHHRSLEGLKEEQEKKKGLVKEEQKKQVKEGQGKKVKVDE